MISIYFPVSSLWLVLPLFIPGNNSCETNLCNMSYIVYLKVTSNSSSELSHRGYHQHENRAVWLTHVFVLAVSGPPRFLAVYLNRYICGQYVTGFVMQSCMSSCSFFCLSFTCKALAVCSIHLFILLFLNDVSYYWPFRKCLQRRWMWDSPGE